MGERFKPLLGLFKRDAKEKKNGAEKAMTETAAPLAT